MIERSLFYWGRLFSGQLQSGNSYQKLERTVCINLLSFDLLDTAEYHSCYVLKERERNEQLSDLLEIHFIELDKIKDIQDAGEIKTQLEAWLEFIKHPESQVSYELAHQHETIREAKDELLVLSCNEKYRLYYEARLKALLDETSRLQTARDSLHHLIRSLLLSSIREGQFKTMTAFFSVSSWKQLLRALLRLSHLP